MGTKSKVKIFKATVKYAVGKKFPSKYGGKDRINVVFLDETGVSHTLWGEFDDPLLNYLSKSQEVRLVDDDGDISILETPEIIEALASAEKENEIPPQVQSESIGAGTKVWSAKKRVKIAELVQQNADLLGYCLKISKDRFYQPGIIQTEESVRSLAVTLFIQAMRDSQDIQD